MLLILIFLSNLWFNHYNSIADVHIVMLTFSNEIWKRYVILSANYLFHHKLPWVLDRCNNLHLLPGSSKMVICCGTFSTVYRKVQENYNYNLNQFYTALATETIKQSVDFSLSCERHWNQFYELLICSVHAHFWEWYTSGL